MADEEKQEPTAAQSDQLPADEEPTAAQSDQLPADESDGGGTGGDIGLTMSYITSIPGILKMVEFFTVMLAFAIAGNLTSYYGTWGRMSFFLFVTITSWLLVIAAFILFAFNVISKINININWNIPVLVFAVGAAFLLLISSSLIADNAKGSSSALDKLRAAAAFGFISMFVFIGDAVVHFLEIQRRM